MTNVTEDGIEIQMEFSDPTYVSLQPDPDVAEIEIIYPEMIFSTENGLLMKPEDSLIRVELPKQLPSGIVQEVVEAQMSGMVSAIGVIPIIGIIIQLYLSQN